MTRYPTLWQFFGGYMHQDWRLDYADEWSVLDDFIRSEPGGVEGFCMEAAELLATEPSEEDLRKLLLDEYGAAAMVENRGWRYRDWMQAMLDHASKATGHPRGVLTDARRLITPRSRPLGTPIAVLISGMATAYSEACRKEERGSRRE